MDLTLQKNHSGVESALLYAKAWSKYIKDLLAWVEKRLAMGEARDVVPEKLTRGSWASMYGFEKLRYQWSISCFFLMKAHSTQRSSCRCGPHVHELRQFS